MSMTGSFLKASEQVGSLFDIKSPRYSIVSVCYPISDEIKSNKFANVRFNDDVKNIAKYTDDKKALIDYKE